MLSYKESDIINIESLFNENNKINNNKKHDDIQTENKQNNYEDNTYEEDDTHEENEEDHSYKENKRLTNKNINKKSEITNQKSKDVDTKEKSDMNTHYTINPLIYMKKGAVFLKYGEYGYPHFRQFELTNDNMKIRWFSNAKTIDKSTVDICDINEIRLGQTTSKFLKHLVPSLERISFSIIYCNYQKTLDLIASDAMDFKIWIEGIKYLLQMYNEDGPKGVENANVLFKIKKKIVNNHSDKEKQKNNDYIKDKISYMKLYDNFVELKSKFIRRTEKSRELMYQLSPINEQIQNKIKTIKMKIKCICDLFNGADYTKIDQEIWNTNNELDLLKQMMQSVKN